MGRPGKVGNAMAVKLMDLPITAEQFYQKQQDLKKELFPHAKKMPGECKMMNRFNQVDGLLDFYFQVEL